MTYEISKVVKQQLEAETQAAIDKLNAIRGNERGPMGLTPDHIKFSPEYQQANAEFEKAFQVQRKFNAKFSRQYKNEIRAEYRDRRTSTDTRHDRPRA